MHSICDALDTRPRLSLGSDPSRFAIAAACRSENDQNRHSGRLTMHAAISLGCYDEGSEVVLVFVVGVFVGVGVFVFVCAVVIVKSS